MKLEKISGLGLFVGILLTGTVYAEGWDKKFFNPKEMDDDIVLPMPCEGTMVWRPVKTSTHKLLEDKPVVLGSEDGEQKFAEYTTPNFIAGSFSDADGERYFLMSKYEITQLQFQAVMNEECPKADMKGRLPITDISWFDAMDFAHKYNLWLLKNAKDKLPVDDNSPGFVRLPTNTEWEYAARGGAKVSESEFRAKVFPMSEGIAKYVWGTKSANGRLQLTGLLNGNPLGLFDMLGNASEMTFDSFKANKLDRYHGRSAGMAVRGGSYLTPEDQITSAFRVEQPYYQDDTAFKSKDTGFRLVLVSRIANTSERVQQLGSEWQALGKDSSEDEKVVEDLNKLAKEAENNKALQSKLKALEDSLRASNQAKDEQRDQAVRSFLQLGAFLCSNVSDLNVTYQRANERHKLLCITETEESDTDEASIEQLDSMSDEILAKCPVFLEQAKEAQAVRDFVAKYYADNLVITRQSYGQKAVKKQLEKVAVQLGSQGKSNLQDFLDLHWQQLNSYYKHGEVKQDEWTNACSQVGQN